MEITYGTERLAMYLQGVESVFEIVWNRADDEVTTYADVHIEVSISLVISLTAIL